MTRPRLLVPALTSLALLLPHSVPPSAQSATSTAEEPENSPPVAVSDVAEVDAGSRLRIDVLANDSDDGRGRPEGEEARLEVVDATGGKRVTWTAQHVTFRARYTDGGRYGFEYTVSDGELTATGQVTVRVAPLPARSVRLSAPMPLVALRRAVLEGRVSPVSAGRARVEIQRRRGDRWVEVGTVTTGREGRYRLRHRTDRTGPRRFRAVARWEVGPSARSDVVRRRVIAVPDADVSGPLHRRDVPWSYRSGCPVPPRGLRKVSVNYRTYDGRISRGAIVVSAGAARTIVDVFSAALEDGFPIRSMRPVDRYYRQGRRTPTQSDLAAMRAGNTSAFNCRPVTGNPYRVSQHSYGNAIDVNTIENPYVTGSGVYPATSRRYLDRSPYRRGMILRAGVVARRFARHGWPWGARWAHPDYQHFSANGG